MLMDVSIKAGRTFQHTFPSEWNAFAYVFDGSGTICDKPASVEHAMVLCKGDVVQASTNEVRANNQFQQFKYGHWPLVCLWEEQEKSVLQRAASVLCFC